MAYNSAFQPSYMAYGQASQGVQMPSYQVPSYQPTYEMPKYQPPAQNVGSGIIWVQGEAGAKSYLVAPNTTVLLMDSENSRFYLKSTDASGVPLPLRKFSYTEESDASQTTAQAVMPDLAISQETFNDMAKQLEDLRGSYKELYEKVERLTAEPKRKSVKAVEDNA